MVCPEPQIVYISVKYKLTVFIKKSENKLSQNPTNSCPIAILFQIPRPHAQNQVYAVAKSCACSSLCMVSLYLNLCIRYELHISHNQHTLMS